MKHTIMYIFMRYNSNGLMISKLSDRNPKRNQLRQSVLIS